MLDAAGSRGVDLQRATELSVVSGHVPGFQGFSNYDPKIARALLDKLTIPSAPGSTPR